MDIQERIRSIVDKVKVSFRCFGDGRGHGGNPIAAALADFPPQFAAGVDVTQVVSFVLSELPTHVAMEKALRGVLHHNAGLKEKHKLPASLVTQIENALQS